jgi:hypothetical protein
MRKYNIIVSIVLFLLTICILYLKPQYEGIEVDPMGDGQSGIGKAMVALTILGGGLLSLLLAVISGILLLVKPAARTKLGFINLIVSIIIPGLTIWYFFG